MTRLPIPPLLVTLALSLWTFPKSAHADERDDPLSDDSVRYAVEVKLTKDPVVFSHDLDTRVQDGIVTLEGHVQNLVMKERAVRLTGTRRGVCGVVDRLEVRPLPRSDEQIAEGVRHAIENAPLHEAYEDVAISVNDGMVVLKGEVPSGISRRQVGSIAAGILGVRAIDNRITLDQEQMGDEELRTTIEARLRNDLRLANSDVRVDVEDGFVNLKGSVLGEALLQRAADLSQVRGTVEVSADQLEVNPSQQPGPGGPLTRSDQEIAEAIEAAWKLDPRIRSESNLEVYVFDGEATLTGKTARLSGLAAAVDDAWNIFGISQVVNLAKVRPNFPVLDEAIENLVVKAIENDAVLSVYEESLEIAVQNGRVEILGLVENDFHKRRVSKLVSRVAGVKQIRNRLKTEADHSLSRNSTRSIDDGLTHRSDEELEEAIEFELFWNWEVSPGKIDVTVDDGVAVLSGEVANLHARDAATEAALEVGAPSVINNVVFSRDSANSASSDTTTQ